jgi:hypothetical protein
MSSSANNKTIKKSAQLTVIVSVILWASGFIFAPFLVESISNFMESEFILFALSELVTVSASLGFLLGFCAVCAGFVLIIYARRQQLSVSVFFSALLVLLVVGGISIGLKLLWIKNFFQKFPPLPESSFTYDSLSFFSWGSPFVALVTIILVYLAGRTRQRDNSTANSNHE